jgi:PIN domain nuclease of toxin-antitoxin system
MDTVIYLDTHVAFWLYAEGSAAPLSEAAREALRGAAEIRISPMVRLELQYLYETERIGVPAAPVLEELGAVLGLRTCDAPFAAVVLAAESEGWTRDPFDRLIVAQASLSGAPLVTKDPRIREHYSRSVW